MQIHLYIKDDNFCDNLRDTIDSVEGLDQYTHILPKSIQINTINLRAIYPSTSFVEKLVQIFDSSITSFNEIKCYYSVRSSSSRFLKDIAKRVFFMVEYDKDEEEVIISGEDHHE